MAVSMVVIRRCGAVYELPPLQRLVTVLSHLTQAIIQRNAKPAIQVAQLNTTLRLREKVNQLSELCVDESTSLWFRDWIPEFLCGVKPQMDSLLRIR